jgi:dihydrofolate reductase
MNSPIVSIIVAVGKNREIGKKNGLLWRLPEEIKRFKKLTTGHTVIMGRKTFQSIPEKFRPLPNRTNIVITRDSSFKPEGVIVTHSMEEALSEARKIEKEEIFNMGGGEIYKLGLPHARRLYLTLVHKEFPEADTFFPEYSEFSKAVFREDHEDKDVRYTFLTLEK